MKKWLLRIFFLIVAVATLLCCMGMDVNCDGEFQGLSCSFDGCKDAHEHDFKIIEEVKATCSEEGYTKSECKKCHYIKTVTQYKIAHDFTSTLHRGICQEDDDKYADGSWYDYLVCSRCDYTEKDYYYSGLNIHLYDDGEVVPLDECGCGRMVYTCLICGNKRERDFGFHCANSPQQQELNERYENNTCGTYLKTCELCHRTVTKVWHKDYTETVLVEPTKTEYGLKKCKCTQTTSGATQHCVYDNWEWVELLPLVTE